VLGAVYRGEDELSESLCSIPYLAMFADAHNFPVLGGGEYFYCKGNPTTLR